MAGIPIKIAGSVWGEGKVRNTIVGATGVVGVGLLYCKTRSQPKKVIQTADTKNRFNAEGSLTLVVSDLVCGALGYLAQMVVLYPLDTLKIKCQAQSVNFIEGVRRLVASNNLGALFAGVGGSAGGSCLVGAVYFATYAYAKRLALERTSNHNDPGGGASSNIGVELFASLCCWVATGVVDAPFEMLRHQKQAGMLKAGIMDGMVSCFRRGGMVSLYCCLIPYMIKSLPFDVAELMTHGCLNDLRKSSNFDLHVIPDQAWDLLIGCAAGAAAVISSMPLDCIKTRMEVEALSGVHKGFIQCGVGMVRNEGLTALWRGIIPRLMLYVPGAALYWLAIDSLQRSIGR